MPIPESAVLARLVGRQLSSVEFVQDYVQLRFDGPTLSVYANPTIAMPGERIDWESAEFKNRLCGLIGRTVVQAGFPHQGLMTIGFEPDTAIEIPIVVDDSTGPEAAMFQDGIDWFVLP